MKEKDKKELLGAIARGWCYPKNGNKTMDSDLALAIYEEVNKWIETHTKKKVKEALNNILEENHCDLDGTYDYDGIAETVIKLCKNK